MKTLYNFTRYDIPRGVKNLKTFFEVVWNYRRWDYTFSLELFKAGLIQLKDCLIDGNEIDETRLPKVKAISRAIEILDHVVNDDHLYLVEKKNTSEIYQGKFSTTELEEKEWDELKNILFGDDSIPGSNLKGWWD